MAEYIWPVSAVYPKNVIMSVPDKIAILGMSSIVGLPCFIKHPMKMTKLNSLGVVVKRTRDKFQIKFLVV